MIADWFMWNHVIMTP